MASVIKPSKERLAEQAAKLNTIQMACIYGVHVKTIRKWLHEYEIPIPGGERGHGGTKKKNIDVDYIVKLADSGMSRNEIASVMGVSTNLINRRLYEIGYKRPVRLVENPKGVNCLEYPKYSQTCEYGSGDVCMYVCFGKGRRPCPAWDCTEYKKRTRKPGNGYPGEGRWYD